MIDMLLCADAKAGDVGNDQIAAALKVCPQLLSKNAMAKADAFVCDLCSIAPFQLCQLVVCQQHTAAQIIGDHSSFSVMLAAILCQRYHQGRLS